MIFIIFNYFIDRFYKFSLVNIMARGILNQHLNEWKKTNGEQWKTEKSRGSIIYIYYDS